MSRLALAVSLFIAALPLGAFAANAPTTQDTGAARADVAAPHFRYRPGDETIHLLHASARYIERDGRTGTSFASIFGRASIPRHTLNQPKGSLALWVLPLQDMHTTAMSENPGKSNPFYDRFVYAGLKLLGTVGDLEDADNVRYL